jgi:hypothetical protein
MSKHDGVAVRTPDTPKGQIDLDSFMACSGNARACLTRPLFRPSSFKGDFLFEFEVEGTLVCCCVHETTWLNMILKVSIFLLRKPNPRSLIIIHHPSAKRTLAVRGCVLFLIILIDVKFFN